MAAPKKHKLDVFKLIAAIDRRDYGFYKTLTDEEKKGFVGPVAMRWMSAAKGSPDLMKYYIMTINDNVNKSLFNPALTDHPELRYQLLAISGLGGNNGNTNRIHHWISGPKKKNMNKAFTFLKEVYPTANNEELELFLGINEIDELLQLARDMGYQDKEVTELKKELKKVK